MGPNENFSTVKNILWSSKWPSESLLLRQTEVMQTGAWVRVSKQSLSQHSPSYETCESTHDLMVRFAAC